MGRNLSPEFIRLLLAAGCRLLPHGKGGHDVWERPITAHRFPVDAKILSHHTANTVLKGTGLPKAF